MNEQAIFLAALDKDPAERAAFLDEACAGDTALLRGVETLLRLHAEANDFLEVPALEQLAVIAPGPANAQADLSFLAPSSEQGSLGRLDHYEVLEVVGRGGMGVVLRARDSKLLRVVAIKVLTAPLAGSGSARQRFVREARAVAPFREGLVVGVECLFAWYWLADLCHDQQIDFVLGHALYMKAIHGGKAKKKRRRKGDAAHLLSSLSEKELRPLFFSTPYLLLSITLSLCTEPKPTSASHSGFTIATPLASIGGLTTRIMGKLETSLPEPRERHVAMMRKIPIRFGLNLNSIPLWPAVTTSKP